jgi:hypothetical protein
MPPTISSFLIPSGQNIPGGGRTSGAYCGLGGLLVVDNATSHPEQMAPFVALVSADAEFSTSLVPVGNGEFLAVRSLE